jgi:hypothetical protein
MEKKLWSPKPFRHRVEKKKRKKRENGVRIKHGPRVVGNRSRVE